MSDANSPPEGQSPPPTSTPAPRVLPAQDALRAENARLGDEVERMAALYRATVAAINAAFEEIHKAERQEPARSHFRRGLNGAASIMQRHCAAAEVAASDSSANRQPLAAPVPAPHAPPQAAPAAREVRLTKAELDALLEYSTSLPTGTTPGKRWKRRVYSGAEEWPVPSCWILGEYGKVHGDQIDIRWTPIVVIDPPPKVETPLPEQPEAAPTEGLVVCDHEPTRHHRLNSVEVCINPRHAPAPTETPAGERGDVVALPKVHHPDPRVRWDENLRAYVGPGALKDPTLESADDNTVPVPRLDLERLLDAMSKALAHEQRLCASDLIGTGHSHKILRLMHAAMAPFDESDKPVDAALRPKGKKP